LRGGVVRARKTSRAFCVGRGGEDRPPKVGVRSIQITAAFLLKQDQCRLGARAIPQFGP
jgi:hypothetical protein